MSTLSSAIDTYLSDSALVADAMGGNHFAFDELCKRHSTKLTRCIRRILGDRADAEDVLQDEALSREILKTVADLLKKPA